MKEQNAFIRHMPKLELHVHLESTIDGIKLEQYAHRQGKHLPRSGDAIYQCSAVDLSNFLSFLDMICSMVGDRGELEEIAHDFSLRSREENILYAEAILNPTHWPQFSHEEIIVALTEGFDHGVADGGADCRFTLSLSRNQTTQEAMALVSCMEHCRTHRLVGLSIDGNEALSGRTGKRFAPAFAMAKRAGFGLTVHAGESSGPEGVTDALDDLHADRIDHGVRAAEDPSLVKRLVREQIPLNLCLTSNLTLLYRNPQQHPIRRLWDEGAKITLSRDDPTFLVLSLTEELTRCADFAGFTLSDLLRAEQNAVDAAFCERETKRSLQARLDAFSAMPAG